MRRQLLTVAEAAALLGVSTARVRQLVAAGRLKSLKVSPRKLFVYPQSVRTFERRRPGRPRKR